MEDIDYDDEINDFLNFNSGKKKIVKNEEPKVVMNDCLLRRERDAANKEILTDTMKGYTELMDCAITGEKLETKDVEIAKPKVIGESNWAKHKKLVELQEDDFVAAIKKALYPDQYLSKPIEEEENSYEQELSRLQDERTLRYQHEQQMAKNRTNNKIKSKNYHKHMRKRDMSFYLEKASKTQDKGEFKEKLECLRAEERISLKHKSGGKFAKLKKLSSKMNDNTKEALENMYNKGKELCQKIDVDTDSDENNDVDNIASSDEDSNIEEMAVDNAHMDVAVNHNLRTLIKEGADTKVNLQVANLVDSGQTMLFDYNEHVMNDSNEVQLCSNEELFKEAIYQIYNDDEDLANEFEREKAKLVEKEAPKDVSTFLPGWGSWTGPGLEKKDEIRREKGLIKAPIDNRKDQKKSRVYIKQGVHEGLKKHLVKRIPYPYNTIEQFEMSRKQLITSAFNHEIVSKKLCKPRRVIKAGVPIKPCTKVFTKNNLNRTVKK